MVISYLRNSLFNLLSNLCSGMKVQVWFVWLMFGLGLVVSCKKKDDEKSQPPPVSSEEILEGELTSEKVLDASKKYLIRGNYIVREGGVLRIPAGTVIFGDRATKGTLIVDRGGKIYAEGTAERPIVFTSKFGPGERDRGDWGGVILLGRAPINQSNVAIEGISPPLVYGGTDPNDDSGVLRYVRIEFAGVALTPNNEVNSLTLGGVGRGTVIEHVQVSYGGDDGFEWYGGTVDGKYLVSFGTWDDDFDTDFGYQGRVQFALAIRDPFGADQSGSNGFECDNDASGSMATPYTMPVFSNVTVIGPIDKKGAVRSTNYQNALHFRRSAGVSLFNSVIAGFPSGFRVDGAQTVAHYRSGDAVVGYNVLLVDSSSSSSRYRGTSGSTDSTAQAIWEQVGPGNQTLVEADLSTLVGYSPDNRIPFFVHIQGQANPTLQLPSNSPLASGADFSHGKLQGGFFQQVSFRGALSPAGDWTDGWTNFDPQNATY